MRAAGGFHTGTAGQRVKVLILGRREGGRAAARRDEGGRGGGGRGESGEDHGLAHQVSPLGIDVWWNAS